jgi:hypothetical protein
MHWAWQTEFPPAGRRALPLLHAPPLAHLIILPPSPPHPPCPFAEAAAGALRRPHHGSRRPGSLRRSLCLAGEAGAGDW